MVSEILTFIDGHQSLITVFEKIGMNPDALMESYCISADKSQVQNMNTQCAAINMCRATFEKKTMDN